ncbi:MAG: DUF3820 family protein [Dehalococcoidales bacterium]|jgi:uncharacterized protein (DUF3820 family)|nr:DUF3820 family protein [Dehalococcoidales bacterium]MDD3265481.1 DUF3820 family protein [Dehalococcoidales bacterium]MDD4323021.1 DUF3820 family protein [Dehalococcoidales bacterium]MDD4794614.1 DUF3820 family protein [Dehalococcoidales bacterium]MDD5121952.1 DUF3820 family protein [Dehalococcoidales bacterium]
MEPDKYNPANTRVLLALSSMQMPYGKYKGRILCDLPEPYLAWMSRKGFPQGELGFLLSSLHEIKVNGLEYLLKPLKNKKPPE